MSRLFIVRGDPIVYVPVYGSHEAQRPLGAASSRIRNVRQRWSSAASAVLCPPKCRESAALLNQSRICSRNSQVSCAARLHDSFRSEFRQ